MVIDARKIEVTLAERGLTKAQLAGRCGMSRQAVSTVIRRGTCEPKTAGRLAAGLDMQVCDITKDG